MANLDHFFTYIEDTYGAIGPHPLYLVNQQTPLLTLAVTHFPQYVLPLLEKGADVNIYQQHDYAQNTKNSPLFQAVLHQPSLISLLLQYKANPFFYISPHQTILDFACSCSLSSVQHFLENGIGEYEIYFKLYHYPELFSPQIIEYIEQFKHQSFLTHQSSSKQKNLPEHSKKTQLK